MQSCCFSDLRNSYTIPTRAVWDLLPEPEGEGNKSHAARGVCGITILKPTIVTRALPSDSLTSLIIAIVTIHGYRLMS